MPGSGKEHADGTGRHTGGPAACVVTGSMRGVLASARS
jgi:hypothetical protein